VAEELAPRLHARRRRDQELAEREADGEDFWTTTFPKRVRVRVAAHFDELARAIDPTADLFEGITPSGAAQALLEKDLGETFQAWNDERACPHGYFPSVVEAMAYGLRARRGGATAADFEATVRRILLEERVAYDFVDGQMVEKASEVLHAELVLPALHLLKGRPDLAGVESAFRKALDELHGGDPADAVTDAGTALQELLQALGAHGNQLGDLLRDAKKQGLLAAHDQRYTKAIENLIHWTAADRSEKGDAHNASPAEVADGWLTLHVVGALILRLADAAPSRDTTRRS
jgi:hypothetical protein